MYNPYGYIDPSQCNSAVSAANAVKHNEELRMKEREERIEDFRSALATSYQVKAAPTNPSNVRQFTPVSSEAEQLLQEIIDHEQDGEYWEQRFEDLSNRDESILRGTFGELQSAHLIKVLWASNIPDEIFISKDGYLYEKHMEEMKPMSDFERQLKTLLYRSEKIAGPDDRIQVGTAKSVLQDEWMNDVQIFHSTYLKEHPLNGRINTLLFHRKFSELVSCLVSISKDKPFIDKMNGIAMVSVPAYQAKTLPEYDVFISHANADKEKLIDELNESLKKLGVKIFYDKEELEWGDNWKDRILNGTQKAEFAIIVISQNFFDREWTERELNEFLNRQNRNGQKLILPILHNITVQQLKEKYPSVADIQAIDSRKYTCDQIALLFARQLIKRLKSV